MTEITLPVPPAFVAFCAGNRLTPAQVLAAFMHDLAETAESNGSDERMCAAQWFDRVVWAEPVERTYTIEPRKTALGGGWQLRFYEDRKEAGGGVFPADPSDPKAVRAAHDEAMQAGEDWIDGDA